LNPVWGWFDSFIDPRAAANPRVYCK
jgi:hypothetical protein